MLNASQNAESVIQESEYKYGGDFVSAAVC